jgi:hypothetical protein
MGTRSLTFVYEDSGDGQEPVMCMYRQFDGYPSGHGAELAEFLIPFEIVNGDGAEVNKVANGMGCLAAQMIVNFKKSVGGFYIHAPVLGRDYSQDYEYHVYEDKVVIQNPGEIIFSGTWNEFRDFCCSTVTE